MFYTLALHSWLPPHWKTIRVPPLAKSSSSTPEDHGGFYFVAFYPCSSHGWSAQGTPWIALIHLVESILALDLLCVLQGKISFHLCASFSAFHHRILKGGIFSYEREQFSCFTSADWVPLWKLLSKCFTLVDSHFSVNRPVNRASMIIFHA